MVCLCKGHTTGPGHITGEVGDLVPIKSHEGHTYTCHVIGLGRKNRAGTRSVTVETVNHSAAR